MRDQSSLDFDRCLGENPRRTACYFFRPPHSAFKDFVAALADHRSSHRPLRYGDSRSADGAEAAVTLLKLSYLRRSGKFAELSRFRRRKEVHLRLLGGNGAFMVIMAAVGAAWIVVSIPFGIAVGKFLRRYPPTTG